MINNNDLEKVESCQNDVFSRIDANDPHILDTIARQYERKIVGLPNEIKTLVCCLLSKDLPRQYRTSVIISNQSSTGKSYLLNNVLEPFKTPEEPLIDPVIDYTDFSEAHFKRSQSNVNGKIIKIEQLERRDENGKLSFQKLKHMVSEGRLKFGNVDNNEDGTRQAKDFEIVGVPVIATTTTEFNIDSETANRFLMMQLDESEDQTKKIISYTLKEYSTLGFDSEDDSVGQLRELFKGFKEYAHHIDRILIPFAEKLEKIIPKTLEMRRDLKKILNLACLIAFIHGFNRDHFISKKQKQFFTGDSIETTPQNTFIIVATPEDLKMALEIAGDSIKQTINKSSKKLMGIDSILRELNNKKDVNDMTGITVKEVSDCLDIGETRTREYLNELCDKGFTGKDITEKIHKYYPKNKKFTELNVSEITFSDQEYDTWVKKIEEEIKEQYSFVPSCHNVSDSKSNTIASC